MRKYLYVFFFRFLVKISNLEQVQLVFVSIVGQISVYDQCLWLVRHASMQIEDGFALYFISEIAFHYCTLFFQITNLQTGQAAAVCALAVLKTLQFEKNPIFNL